jgi:hypothetical protein
MAISILTFVNWRSTLVTVQGSLQGVLTSAQSAEGYALLAALQVAGATYDAAGDDSPRNASAFSAGTAQPYMIASVPLFAEADRVFRLIYSTYASTATLAQGQAFGLYAGLTVLPPGLQSPGSLVFLWDSAAALWTQLAARASAASAMVQAAGNAALFALAVSAYDAAIVYQTPPVNPSPPAAAASHAATVAVNTAVANAQAWTSSLSFS